MHEILQIGTFPPLAQKMLGIVGVGHIGKETARRLEPWGSVVEAAMLTPVSLRAPK